MIKFIKLLMEIDELLYNILNELWELNFNLTHHWEDNKDD